MPAIAELKEIWNISRELTLEYVYAMAGKHYLFRPAGLTEVFTNGRQMQHIAENKAGLLSRYITEIDPPDISLDREDDNSSIMENIDLSFEYGITALNEINVTDLTANVGFSNRRIPRWHVLFIAQNHTTHHCGQAVVYLNAKGIEPPYYRKW